MSFYGKPRQERIGGDHQLEIATVICLSSSDIGALIPWRHQRCPLASLTERFIAAISNQIFGPVGLSVICVQKVPLREVSKI